MILTLLSMFGGGLMRLLPEVFSFLNKKTDNTHELAMLDKQFELEKTRAVNRMAEVELQGNFTEMLSLLDAQKSALEGQMQKTNIWWVDALNFLVRPLTTYFFLLMYGIAKIAMFFIAYDANLNTWETIVNIYDAEDRAILSGILSFWFVGRVFDKKK
jgi:hypothetical protein